MIRVIVQLVDARLPDHDPKKVTVIATAEIINDGTLSDGSGNSAMGRYFGAFRYHSAPADDATYLFEGVTHRRSDRVWRLIGRCIEKAMGPLRPSKSPPNRGRRR